MSKDLIEQTLREAAALFRREQRASSEFYRVRDSLRTTAQAHNSRRLGALIDIWERKRIAWCSLGQHEVSAGQIKHVLFRRREWRDWGEYGMFQVEEELRNLQTGCEACRKASRTRFELVDEDYSLTHYNTDSDDRLKLPESVFEKNGLPGKATVQKDSRYCDVLFIGGQRAFPPEEK